MIKPCVICGTEFDAPGSAKTCTLQCSELLREESDRLYHAANREKILAYKAAYRERRRALLAPIRAAKAAVMQAKRAKLAAVKEEKRAARRAKLEELELRKVRECIVCESKFRAKNNVKTCSESCWLSRHRNLRQRPEKNLNQDERLRKKRDASNKLYARRTAALRLVREFESKGLEMFI